MFIVVVARFLRVTFWKKGPERARRLDGGNGRWKRDTRGALPLRDKRTRMGGGWGHSPSSTSFSLFFFVTLFYLLRSCGWGHFSQRPVCFQLLLQQKSTICVLPFILFFTALILWALFKLTKNAFNTSENTQSQIFTSQRQIFFLKYFQKFI